KLLNEGKTIASLARKFKVTQTQIIRIKKNENWASVEAAK
ncbi:MAG: HNH endonuclease, partial [Chitinophagaceae bacterium]|nr:HNH endonuclease [Chitinophagaceae bacterium]